MKPRIGIAMLVLGLGCGVVAAPAPAAGPSGVLDGRAWEMVSPVEKNGGEVALPAVGLLQAAAQGGALAFASEASFGESVGAPPLSQYLATRGGGGWGSANLNLPLLSGTYSAATGDADPYLLFSADLSRAIISGGWACRGGGECSAEGVPLSQGGPAGYRNAYLAEGSTYQPLITETNFPALPAEAKEFHLVVEGAGSDLHHVVFSSGGLLYEWNEGTIVQVGGAGAVLAAPGNSAGAVSEDGSRVYFSEGGELKLREGAATKLLVAGAEFGAASADGSVAFYLVAGHVHRYLAASEVDEDLTPGGGATAILGVSPDGGTLFYVAAGSPGGIFRWHAGTATKIVSAANLAHLPPATGPTAVAADGARLFFTSADSLVPLADSNGQPDAYEWEAQGAGNCATSPGCLGLLSSGRTGSATFAAASASGDDAYFLTSASLLPADTSALDVYDARVGGGFSEPQPGIECEGDDCQGPPFVPQDPAPATSVISGPPNSPARFRKEACPKEGHVAARSNEHGCGSKHHRRRHKKRGTGK